MDKVSLSAADCRRVVSVSLGSSKRDAQAQLELDGVQIQLQRCGTDGDFAKARRLLAAWDGQADAIGLGGTDLYVYAGGRRYTFRESARLISGVRQTPVLDGSGLKNSLERRVVNRLAQQGIVNFKGSKVLLVCGADRFGMAEALQAVGARLTLGDLLYGLGVNMPLYSLKALGRWARVLAPVITRLPIGWFYPMGAAQEKRSPRYPEYFLENEVIAGDFHYIKKFMPDELPGKIVLTNTVTAADRQLLRQAGVRLLVTTTPCLGGRSFGTNVMEACLVALQGAKAPLSAEEYLRLLERYHIEASVEYLNSEE